MSYLYIKILVLLIGSVLIIVSVLNLFGEVFNPLVGVYIQKPIKKIASYRVQNNLFSIQLIQEYRPKGQNYDFPIVTISRQRTKTSATSINTLVDNRIAKRYYLSDGKGVIAVVNPPINIEYNLQNGQAVVPNELLSDLVGRIKILY